MTTTFRTWEQLTEIEQLQGEYSDTHKEAYGFRPRFGENWTAEDYRAEIARVRVIAQQVWEEEQATQLRNADAVETKLADLIKLGAKDRATAIRWLMAGEDADSLDHLCYNLDIPYGYFGTG